MFMRHVVIGTAGHIDHGKSTLVFALTGTDPDRLQEEKRRGITIDLGFAHMTEGDVVLSFVDVPGHERFVRNMLAGVGGMDLVMLHVAADESVMPQTREHFEICRLLHVPAGLVVMTKADLVDADTLDVVRLEVQELVAGSFLEGAPIVAVSAKTGSGLPELRATLASLASRAVPRRADGPPRLPIDRVFTMRGFGTVVTGTLVAGRIRHDDELRLLPSGRAVKVRGLQVHGRTCPEAMAGQRVAVNLSGIDVGDVARGETLTADDAVSVTRRVDVRIELLGSVRPLRHGAFVRFHQGTRELGGRVALASGSEMPPGETAFARLHLEAPAALVRGDRFIIRTFSPPETIGGGVVLDPLPPRRGVRSEAGAARYAKLADVSAPDVAVGAMVQEAGLRALPVVQLGARAGVAPAEQPLLVERLVKAGTAVEVGGLLVEREAVAAARQRVLEAVKEHHQRRPLEEGIPREQLRERVFASAPHAVFEHVLSVMTGAGEIVARDRVALRGRALALTDEEAKARDAIAHALEEAALAPPHPVALAARLGIAPPVVDRMAALLARQKVLVRIGDLYFHHAVLDRLKADVRALKREQAAETIDVGTFKQRYQVSRKYAIPLLEFLDRERVTRRAGDARLIL
jgi:selenocysteine-specific elongation factor